MLNFKHKHVVQTRDPKLAFYSTTGDPIDNTKKIFARHILSMEIGEIKYNLIHTSKKAVALLGLLCHVATLALNVATFQCCDV